jgi:uncharacterized membrane protein YccC
MAHTTRSPSVAGAVRRWAARPELHTDLVQVVKTVIATVAAWLLAVRVFELDQPFLAPWAALLTVHATVYRTLWRGTQSVLSTTVGILLSFAAVQVLGYGPTTLGLAVLLGLLVARTPLLRDEGVTVATTALFVLTAGYGNQEQLLLHRFLDTVVGVAVGLVVNLLVAPPLDDRVAERVLDRAAAALGELLRRMARELRPDMDDAVSNGWVEESRRIDRLLDEAESHLGFTRESRWGNPRRRRSRRTTDVERATALLVRLEDGVAHARATARIVGEATGRAQAWDDDFRRRWTGLLERTAGRLTGPENDVDDVRADLDRLTEDLSGERLPGLPWPVYGALVTALRSTAGDVDAVVAERAALAG